MREIDPNVKIVMDVVAFPEEAERIAPYHDVWIMHMGHLLNDLPRWRPFMAKQRAQGKLIGTYSCSTPPLSQAPLGYSRESAWRVWRFGMKFDWFFADQYVKHWGTGRRPVAARTWEARTQGLEDYLLLYRLRELIDLARKKGTPEVKVRAAEKVLQDAPIRVFGDKDTYWTGDTPEVAVRLEQVRTDLLRAAASLR